jgi:hypothetical protein
MEILKGKTGGSPAKTGKKIDLKLQDFLISNFKMVIILVVIVILGGGYFFLLKPAYDSIMEEALISEDKESEYDGLERKLEQINKMKRDYESISQTDLDKINSILPDSQMKDELLAQLESMVLRNGLLLTSLQIEEVKEKKAVARPDAEMPASPEERVVKKDDGLSNDVGKIKITMDIVGTDYAGLKRILGVIENNTRLLDVDKLNFSPENNKTTLEMSAFYFLKKN